jgi:cobalamin biosynthesis protein CobW
MTAKIHATVITGFLGAGKTTLIQHLLRHANGRRLALVINEFGELGVDGELLRSCGIEACRKTTSSNSPTAASAAPSPTTSCPPSRSC